MTATTFRWTAVVVLATAVDLAGRFLLPFDLMQVMRIEAVLFPLAGIVLLLMVRREPRASGWRRMLQWGLIACFLLAGLRAALWAIGAHPLIANITSPTVFVLSVLVLVFRRRAARTQALN
jgi:NAD(P)-dependent dehydrogenase (short-subunit alcohol dehydrogenase family)